PTLPSRAGFQTIAAQGRMKIGLEEGTLTLILGEERHAVQCRMLVRQWYRIKAAVDAKARRFSLEQMPLEPHPLMNDEGRLSGKLGSLPATKVKGFWLAGFPQANGEIGEHFDGKIDRPSLGRIARWDFSRDIPTTRAVDIGRGRHHGTLVNLPARAMKGHNW